MVLAGIECSPKIFDFRASGIPVQERVDFFDTFQAPLWRGFKYMVKITEGSRVFKYKEIAI